MAFWGWRAVFEIGGQRLGLTVDAFGDAWHFGLDALAAVGLRAGGSGGRARWGRGVRRASTAVAGGRGMDSFQRWPTAVIGGVDGGAELTLRPPARAGWRSRRRAADIDGWTGTAVADAGRAASPAARVRSLPSPA